MGALVPIVLSTRGQLNTADPPSDPNLPPGTLVEALDVHTRYWGPRPGRSAVASVADTGFFVRPVFDLDGISQAVRFHYVKEQMTLGLQWDLEILLEYNALSSGDNAIFVLDGNGSTASIHVCLLGSGEAGGDQGKVKAVVKAHNGTTFVTSVTLTSTTQLTSVSSFGSDPTKIHSIKLSRNGASLTLKINGTTEASSSSFSDTYGLLAGGEGILVGRFLTAASSNTFLNARVSKALLRSGVHTSLKALHHDHVAPWVDHVFFYTTMGSVSPIGITASSNIVAENSRFQNFGIPENISPPIGSMSDLPFLNPFQAIAHYTDRRGAIWCVVSIGGYIGHMRVA